MWHKVALERVGPDGKGRGIWDYTISWDSGDDHQPRKYGACALGECDGHPSAREACEHERQRLLKTAKSVDFSNWGNCYVRGCDSPAKRGWEIPGERWTFHFCDKHNTKETLEAYVDVEESWGS